MHNIADWQRLLSYAGLIGTLTLLLKLYATGLSGIYRRFSGLLFFHALVSTMLLQLKPQTNLYAILWFSTKPVEWILGLAVVLEIYALVLRRYPGIASLTRWSIVAGVIVSLLLSIGSLHLDFQNPNEKFPILRLAFAVQRTMDNTMVWSLLMPWLLMTRFPIRLCRNVVVHCLLFSAFVGIEAGGLFARNLLGNTWNTATNVAMSAGTNLCLLCWILFIGRKGERAERVVLTRVEPEREEYLIGQLKSFNRMILRAAPLGAR